MNHFYQNIVIMFLVMSVEISGPHEEDQLPVYVSFEDKHFVAPGDVITEDVGFMKGHGTYADQSNRYIICFYCKQHFMLLLIIDRTKFHRVI